MTPTQAITATGPGAADRRAYQDLRGRLCGDLVLPGDPTYQLHRRVWNGSVDRFPAGIARCADQGDVVAALRFARRHGLPVAVRGGGHSFPGYSVCDGGMVIDLSPMKRITVDPEAGTARVQAGVLLGELDLATQAFGLAVPAGVVSHTGIAGLTLGGGMGWLMRRYGLTIDQLLAVDLVTAGGERVRASAAENPELFWGVRGGGGNFGIVIEFEFRLSPVGPQVYAGPVFWPHDAAPEVLRRYRGWVADASDDLMTVVVQRRLPALPAVPADLVGRPVIGVVVCYTGQVSDGARAVRPMRSLGRPLLDLCRPTPYLAHQSMFDPGFPHGWWYYVRSCDVAELSDVVIDVIADHGDRIGSPATSVALWQGGGAAARVGEHETAFEGRGAGFRFNINGNSPTAGGFAAEREWARGYWSALAPHHTGVYVNFLMDEGEDRIKQAYGDQKYRRLRALKQAYDPQNVFRLNQNIPPARPAR